MSLKIATFFTTLYFVLEVGQARRYPVTNHENDEYWNRIAKEKLMNGIKIFGKPSKPVKNVILFIGDGMGMSTITAARILKGQLTNKSGEESVLSWEDFPHVALAKTYNTDHQVPDSSGTATALFSGVKTKMSVIGVNDSVQFQQCDTLPSALIPSIADWFHDDGRSAGVVASSRITHATPSCLYGHSVDRNLESDDEFEHYNVSRGRWPEFCKDLAYQLIHDKPGNKLKVVLGGGWGKFLKTDEGIEDLMSLAYSHPDMNWNPHINSNHIIKQRTKRKVFGYTKNCNTSLKANQKGKRLDENLIRSWILQKGNDRQNYAFVIDKEQLVNTDAHNIDYLLGLFSYDHMSYESKRTQNIRNNMEEPSLPEMTAKAIDILSKDPRGFFLLVEASRIDHAHHEGKARLALEETLVLDATVRQVMERLKNENLLNDTLVIVTADHSHVFNLGGYPLRGNPIFGLDREYTEKEFELSDVDGMPYTSITYGNGPGGIDPKVQAARQNLTRAQLNGLDYQAQAAVPLSEETHGGEDVPVYAAGPNSHLIYGVQEQHYIAHVMAFSTCTGLYRHEPHCYIN